MGICQTIILLHDSNTTDIKQPATPKRHALSFSRSRVSVVSRSSRLTSLAEAVASSTDSSLNGCIDLATLSTQLRLEVYASWLALAARGFTATLLAGISPL